MLNFSIFICIYSFLFSFWSDIALGLSISNVKGLSLVNLSIYFSLIILCIIFVKRKKFFEGNKIFVYLAIFLFIGIISIPIKILSGEFRHVRLLQEVISLKNHFEGILVFTLYYNLFDKKQYCKTSIIGLLVLFMFCNVVMLLDWYNLFDIPGIHKRTFGESSGFGNPNDYAVFMLLIIPIIFSNFIFYKKKLGKSIFFVLLIISIWAFYMTGSRGGLVSFIIAFFFYLILMYKYVIENKKMFSFQIAILFLMIIAAPILILPKTYINDLGGKINIENVEGIDEYSHGRKTFWTGGLKVFTDSPIYGHGMKTFVPLLKRKVGVSATAHNRYLLYLVEFGVIGLIVYLLIQFSILKQAYYFLKMPIEKSDKIIFINFITGLVGYFIAVLFVDAWSSQVPYWFYCATALKFGHILKREII